MRITSSSLLSVLILKFIDDTVPRGDGMIHKMVRLKRAENRGVEGGKWSPPSSIRFGALLIKKNLSESVYVNCLELDLKSGIALYVETALALAVSAKIGFGVSGLRTRFVRVASTILQEKNSKTDVLENSVFAR